MQQLGVCMCARRELAVYQPTGYYCRCYYIEGGGARRKKGSERFGSENEFILCAGARCSTQSPRNKRVSPAQPSKHSHDVHLFTAFLLSSHYQLDGWLEEKISMLTSHFNSATNLRLSSALFVYAFSVSARLTFFDKWCQDWGMGRCKLKRLALSFLCAAVSEPSHGPRLRN